MDHNLNRSGRLNDRACEHCAAFFIARRSDQRFCSDRCRLRHWRLLKSALRASAAEGSPADLPTQTAREVLLSLLGEDVPLAVVDRARRAVAELADLERELVRLRRQNAVLQADELGGNGAGPSPEDRRDEC